MSDETPSRRDGAYGRVQEAIQATVAAIHDVGAAHGEDVAHLGKAAEHLAALLSLIERQGWKSSWARDQEIIEEAGKFLAATITKEGGTDAPQGSSTEN